MLLLFGCQDFCYFYFGEYGCFIKSGFYKIYNLAIFTTIRQLFSMSFKISFLICIFFVIQVGPNVA